MSNDILSKITENIPSFKEVGGYFNNLFEQNPQNKILISDLCSGLPEFARECQKKQVVSDTGGLLGNLKNTIV